MLDYNVEFTGESMLVGAPIDSPDQAVLRIGNGILPSNFLEWSESSNAFRQAVIFAFLQSPEDKDESLKNIALAMRGIGNNDSAETILLAGYGAALAYAWDEPILASKFIKRTNPTEADTFLWSVVRAMVKQTPSLFYLSLLLSEGDVATNHWRSELRNAGVDL